MKIGYARVSTADQSLDRQLEKLEEYGCKKIFSEVASGRNNDRSEYKALLEYAREGDTIVVWALDRFARNLKESIFQVESILKRGVNFVVIQQQLDFSSATGKLYFHILSVFAEFERNMIVERTQDGLRRAQAAGKKLGPKRKFSDQQIRRAIDLYYKRNELNYSIKDIREMAGMSTTHLYKVINDDLQKEKMGIIS